ncbi:MAG: ferritin-like domain-containing protein [Egibacteraceae bacterium]
MADGRLLPRNRTARLAQAQAAGNPVVVELESGVGNCFPGLELDVRNLDRRFFPFLAVDFVGGQIAVAEVDLGQAEQELPAGPLLDGLRRVATESPGTWQITRLTGDFAGLGQRSFEVPGGFDSQTLPDAWTAVRLLRPATRVELTLQRLGGGGAATVTLAAPRASYLTDDGAFAAMFSPGELTQSLCSPWTHDFRDCGCFYWASNHPDIVLPALPTGVSPDDPDWGVRTLWLRSARGEGPPPAPDGQHSGEMRHHEINARWQDLDVALDGREQRVPYAPTVVAGVPLAPGQLEPTLRYAAGVELAVMLEYLAAVFSVNRSAGAAGSVLRNDARAARAELLRVAVGEMRHLREVNDLLRDLHLASGAAGPFVPALGVATLIPEPPGSPARPVRYRALTPEALADFVEVEAPSDTVDGLYLGILATFERDGQERQAAVVRSIIADGADHFATFTAIQEWLGRHPGTPYLLTLATPPTTEPALGILQQRYEQVLGLLHRGYTAGVPAGAPDIATARLAMLGPAGVEGACETLAQRGFLATFAVPADPRFAAVPPPQASPP